ncbi:MAG: GxxExxY protein [Syntrophomonas sp.]
MEIRGDNSTQKDTDFRMINTDKDYKDYIYKDLTEKIIACAYKVFRVLGTGFLEKVYENALVVELERCGFKVTQQQSLKVFYEGVAVGDYFADLVVEDKIILELKALNQLDKVHEVQLVNYLKATGIKVGLLINFGDKITIKRRVG